MMASIHYNAFDSNIATMNHVKFHFANFFAKESRSFGQGN